MKTILLRFILALAISIPLDTYCQTWIWGDSCRIDFVNGTAVASKGICSGETSSILQLPNTFFYASAREKDLNIISGTYAGRVFNTNGIKLNLTTGLKVSGIQNTLQIVPVPGDSTKAYVFQLLWNQGPFQYAIYFSKIDLYGNGGVGSMLQVNIPLLQGDLSNSLNVIRHGNGRDWWIYIKECNANSQTPSNLWYRFLLDPTGIHGPYTQNIGQLTYSNIDQLVFDPLGTKAVYLTVEGLFDLFAIDRCTGLFYNHQVVCQKLNTSPPAGPPISFTRMGEFSSNGQYFYTSAGYHIGPSTSFILQFDMLDTNIRMSRKIIHSFSSQINGIYYYPWELRRAPDNKIYLTGFSHYYPFSDTCCFDTTTMYLGVVNAPDSLGLACSFSPFSFYLGGNRTHRCLPDMPNYNIGVAVGSGCDTLVATGIGYEFIDEKNRIHCWPNPASVSVNIRWGGVEKVKHVSLISSAGKMILLMPWQSEFEVMELPIQLLTSGLYVVELQLTSGEKFRKKLMVMKE